MFVEGPREVAFQQLVVVDGFGDDSAHKFEVAEVVGVEVWAGVNGVGDAVTGRGAEQHIHGVKDLPRDDEVPLPQQPARILPLLTWSTNNSRYHITQNTLASYLRGHLQICQSITI